jgi:hypothetical protein
MALKSWELRLFPSFRRFYCPRQVEVRTDQDKALHLCSLLLL